MSWDADIQVGDNNVMAWNYTSNTNPMLSRCVDGAKPWYLVLNGKTGEQGARVLTRIVENLEADPEGFRAMNPSNGWGDYDSLLNVIREMRVWSAKWPFAIWHVAG